MERRLSVYRRLSGETRRTLKLAVSAVRGMVVGMVQASSLVRFDVSYQGNGRIKADKKITVLGQTIEAGVTVAPELVNGGLGFGAAAINGVSGISRTVADELKRIFDVQIPLSRFPFGVRVRSLDATAQGVSVALDGSDLTYTR